jgi:hypothetical protein
LRTSMAPLRGSCHALRCCWRNWWPKSDRHLAVLLKILLFVHRPINVQDSTMPLHAFIVNTGHRSSIQGLQASMASVSSCTHWSESYLLNHPVVCLLDLVCFIISSPRL